MEAKGTGETTSDTLIISHLLGSRTTAWLAKESLFLEGRAQSMTSEPEGQHSLTHSKVYIGLEFHVAGKMREEKGTCRVGNAFRRFLCTKSSVAVGEADVCI